MILFFSIVLGILFVLVGGVDTLLTYLANAQGAVDRNEVIRWFMAVTGGRWWFVRLAIHVVVIGLLWFGPPLPWWVLLALFGLLAATAFEVVRLGKITDLDDLVEWGS